MIALKEKIIKEGDYKNLYERAVLEDMKAVCKYILLPTFIPPLVIVPTVISTMSYLPQSDVVNIMASVIMAMSPLAGIYSFYTKGMNNIDNIKLLKLAKDIDVEMTTKSLEKVMVKR